MEYAKAMEANRKSIQEKMYLDNVYKRWIYDNSVAFYVFNRSNYQFFRWIYNWELLYKIPYISKVLFDQFSHDEKSVNSYANEEAVQHHFNQSSHSLFEVESSLEVDSYCHS